MWLISFIKGFFKPSKSRIFIFILVFILVSIYDLTLRPFPDSPVITNIGGASQTFVINFLIIPYILSCILPSLAELRKRKIFRHAKIWEFITHDRPVLEEENQNLKPATKIQSTYNIQEIESVEKSTESPGTSPRKSKKAAKPKPKKKAKQKPGRSARKPR